jgi:hypothetical protein
LASNAAAAAYAQKRLRNFFQEKSCGRIQGTRTLNIANLETVESGNGKVIEASYRR